MTSQKRFIQELRRQIDEEKLEENQYCIIVYEVFPENRKEVKFIYRNFDSFSSKVEADCEKIDEDNGIYLEWRIYE